MTPTPSSKQLWYLYTSCEVDVNTEGPAYLILQPILVNPLLGVGDGFTFTDENGKVTCWILREIYNGQPTNLPPQFNVQIWNTNYFTTIGNGIYDSQNGAVDACGLCEKDIELILEPTNNFLISVTKDDSQIIDVQPPFYLYDNTYNFPVGVLNPMYGTHNGINNETIFITIQSINESNTNICISLIVNGSVAASQIGTFSSGVLFIDVSFTGVTILPTDTLEIFVTAGDCQ
jgi:hypothetical protein